jgi:four helix bundle protein
MSGFAFKKMQVYQVARALAAELHGVAASMSRPNWRAADQLMGAVLSIMLNIAEGSGEIRPREKARFYRMARRSCHETAAAIDHLLSIKVIPGAAAARHDATLEHLTGSLTALIVSMEQRDAANRPKPRSRPRSP